MFMTAETDLLAPLRRYWGYDSFRPLQERVVRSLIAGRDTCVVMPTGGGKSLCYQLPAVVSDRTVIVISPLIALMQDQATQLAQMGIPAAVLNSTVSENDQTLVMRQARDGAYRLLYLSPERIARGDTIGLVAKSSGRLFCHQRSSLHLRVGTRIPPRIPATEPPAHAFSRSSHCRVHGQRHAPRSSRRSGAAPASPAR